VTAELFYQAGFKAAEDIAQSDLDSVADVDGVGPERAAAIVRSAQEYVARKREEEAAAAAAAAAVETAPVQSAEAEETRE
jgi:hypothetical protein